jgi:hypothetical protein
MQGFAIINGYGDQKMTTDSESTFSENRSANWG